MRPVVVSLTVGFVMISLRISLLLIVGLLMATAALGLTLRRAGARTASMPN